jgi:nuclear migration protein JNM1
LRSEIQELEEDVEQERSESVLQDSSNENSGGSWKGKGKQVSPAIILQQLQLLRGDLAQVKMDEAEFTISAEGEKADAGKTILEQRAQASSSLLSSLSATSAALPQMVASNELNATKELRSREMTDIEMEARITQLENIIGSSEANVDEVRTLLLLHCALLILCNNHR